MGETSIVMLFRVSGGIRCRIPSGPNTPPVCDKHASTLDLPSGAGQAGAELLSQRPSAVLTNDSHEAAGGHGPSGADTLFFPGDHLTWYILLSKSTMCAFLGSKRLNPLFACSEGLNTLGWGLGTVGGVAGVDKIPSGLDSTVCPPLDPPQSPEDVSFKAPKVTKLAQRCPHFAKGFCRYGAGCKFVHQGKPDPSIPSQAAASPEPKKLLCKHYLKGHCNRGQYCKFSHEAGTQCLEVDEALQGNGTVKVAAVQVCPHYARGYCKRGEQCNYSHQAPSGTINVARVSFTALRSQRHQQVFQSQAQGTLSVEANEQGIQGSAPVASGSRESGWQPRPAEPTSLKHAMGQESQAVQTASRKFTAPRPERNFQKGVKIRKLGSTILKGISGTKQRGLNKESVDRPKSHQPCVFAPAPYCKPVAPTVNARPPRPYRANRLPEREIQLTGVMRRTQNHNAPGTRMKACKHDVLVQPLSLEVRLPWADLVDSESDEQSVCSQEASSDMQDDQVEVTHVTFEQGNRKRVGWRAGGGRPHGISSKRWRRYVGSILKGKGGFRHLQTNAVVLPCPEKRYSEKGEMMLQDSERPTVWPSSCASRSSNLDTSVCPPESGREGLGERLSSFSIQPVAAPDAQLQPLPAVRCQISTRGRSPTSRSLGCSPEPVSSERHAATLIPQKLRFSPEPVPNSKPAGCPVLKSLSSQRCECPRPGELQREKRAFSACDDLTRSGSVTFRFEIAPTKLPRCTSLIFRSLRFSPEPVIDCMTSEPVPTTFLRRRSLNPQSFRFSPKPGLRERHAEPMTQRALRGKPEPRPDHTPIGFQVSKPSQSELAVCQQTGEYQVQQMAPSGRVSFRTCYGSGNATASQPETATPSGHFHIPRSRSLGCSLPLVLNLNSSGRARSCSGHKIPQLLPGVSQHTPTTSEPRYPAGAGGGVPAVRCFSQIACLPKHELRNVSKGFNSTLGYPGEGPSMSGAAPVTPPKVTVPKTPPKRSPDSSPPWNRDLEAEVRGLSRSYLERQSRETSCTWTDSRRVLGPPKASAARPRPPPPPRGRRSDVRTAGPSASITAPSSKLLPPPKVLSIETGPGPGSVTSGGSASSVVGKVSPPPLPRRRGLSMEMGRIVKARIPTGFDYEKARAKAKECRDGYRQTQGLPTVRPRLPFNPSTRLNPDVFRVDPKGPQGPGDLPRAQLFKQNSNVASPEDPLRSDDKYEQADPETAPSSVNESGTSCGLIASEEPQDKSVGMDPDSTKGLQSRGNSPEAVVPKFPLLRDSGPEPESNTPDLTPQPVSGSQDFGHQLRECETIQVSVVSEEAQSLGLESTSPIPRVSPPVVGSLEPAIHNLSAPEPAIPKVPQTLGLRRESSTPEVESSQDQHKRYSVGIEIGTSEDASYRTVKITYACGQVEQIRVHASRRVLEILLLAWKPGVQLQSLGRHLQGEAGSAVSLDVNTRVPIGRLIVGSVITARYEEDASGHHAEVNTTLVQTLLGSSQGSEANCNRCDPLRHGRIFIPSSGENVPMLMNLQMQLRAYPIGTTCEEVLTEFQLQSHPVVGLCRAFTHWVIVPKQFRLQPGWGLIIWPVPRPDRSH